MAIAACAHGCPPSDAQTPRLTTPLRSHPVDRRSTSSASSKKPSRIESETARLGQISHFLPCCNLSGRHTHGPLAVGRSLFEMGGAGGGGRFEHMATSLLVGGGARSAVASSFCGVFVGLCSARYHCAVPSGVYLREGNHGHAMAFDSCCPGTRIRSACVLACAPRIFRLHRNSAGSQRGRTCEQKREQSVVICRKCEIPN